MVATLISRLNSCTGFRKASFEDKRMREVFSVCNVKPSGTVMGLSVVILRTGKENKVRRKGLNVEISRIDVVKPTAIGTYVTVRDSD